LDARIADMEIACGSSAVRTFIPMYRTREALYGNYLQRPDGNPRRPDSCINLPINELGKNMKLDRILRGIRMGC